MKPLILGLILSALTAGSLWAQDDKVTASLEGTPEVMSRFLEEIYKDYAGAIEEGTLEVAAPGNRCNGGTCLPNGTTTPVSCPTSGGPVCKSGETCQCTCFQSTTSSPWQTKNQCVSKT